MQSSTKASVFMSTAFTGKQFADICIIEAKFQTRKKPAGVDQAAPKTWTHSEHACHSAPFLKIPYPREGTSLLSQSVEWDG